MIEPPLFNGPAADLAPAPHNVESILNPFSVYRKGEALLRSQLGALSTWHLANIAIRVGRKIRFDPVKEEIVGDEEANRLVVKALAEFLRKAA